MPPLSLVSRVRVPCRCDPWEHGQVACPPCPPGVSLGTSGPARCLVPPQHPHTCPGFSSAMSPTTRLSMNLTRSRPYTRVWKGPGEREALWVPPHPQPPIPSRLPAACARRRRGSSGGGCAGGTGGGPARSAAAGSSRRTAPSARRGTGAARPAASASAPPRSPRPRSAAPSPGPGGVARRGSPPAASSVPGTARPGPGAPGTWNPAGPRSAPHTGTASPAAGPGGCWVRVLPGHGHPAPTPAPKETGRHRLDNVAAFSGDRGFPAAPPAPPRSTEHGGRQAQQPLVCGASSCRQRQWPLQRRGGVGAPGSAPAAQDTPGAEPQQLEAPGWKRVTGTPGQQRCRRCQPAQE